MKYLFIGGHVDEEVCFGGTIIKLIEGGHQVDNIAFNIGTAYESEFDESSKIMGSNNLFVWIDSQTQHKSHRTADYLYQLRHDYDCIFTHSIHDRHPVHRMVAEESRRVFNGNLATYLAPWNGTEDHNYFVELSEQQLEKKIEALACYKSQAHRAYMSPDFIRAQARYNGIKCGKLYAEAFKIERLIQ